MDGWYLVVWPGGLTAGLPMSRCITATTQGLLMSNGCAVHAICSVMSATPVNICGRIVQVGRGLFLRPIMFFYVYS